MSNKTKGVEITEKQAKPIVLVSAAALVDKDGYVLVTERPKGKYMAGYWEFPGGKIEQDETPEASIIRELKEELAIVTETSCLAPLSFVSHPYDDFHLLMTLFVCRVWEGSPKSIENQQIKWVKPIDMMKMNFLPADIPLIAHLRDNI